MSKASLLSNVVGGRLVEPSLPVVAKMVGQNGFVSFRAPRRRRFVSRRGEEARMGGGDAPTPARRSLKPGGGKSSLDRQRRSFAAPRFVVARSAASSRNKFKEPIFLQV